MRITAALTGTIGPAKPVHWLAGIVLFGVMMLSPGRAQTPPAGDLNEIRARAGKSDPEAQNALGNIYTNGLLGVRQDLTEALSWYRQAAEKGYAPALFNLGLANELGRGVPADERQAFKYYLMAAEQGFAAAQFNVGNMYSAGRGVGQDLFEANLWYKQAAEKGVIEAQFNLGLAYETGRGVKKDELQAARWYKQAGDRGFARAQYNLALLLEDGRGMPKNEAAAAGYYRSAAEQGFAMAQNNYGQMLFDGRGGLAKDSVQAYIWLSLGVANGANPAARDFVAKSLSADQLAAANNLLSERIPGSTPAVAPTLAPASAGAGSPSAAGRVSAPLVVPTSPSAPENAAAAARVAELSEALNKARQANTQFAEVNQRLELEKARLEQELAKAGESGRLIEQLRDQSRRLSEQVQNLTADKDAALRETTVLAAQMKDVQQELAQQKAAVRPAVPAAPAADVSQYESQIAALSARLEQANASLSQLQQTNQQLTEGNAQLQKEKDALAAAKPGAAGPADTARYPVQSSDKDAIIASLQRDNQRLNDEVKRSTRELLALNQQVRGLRGQTAAKPAAPGTGDNTASAEMRTESQRVDANNTRLQSQRDAAVSDAENLLGQLREARSEVTRLNEQIQQLRSTRQSSDAASDQLAQLNSKAALAAAEATRLQTENSRLAARMAELEKQPRSVAGEPLAPRLAQAHDTIGQLQQQLQVLQADKAGLEKSSQAQEKNLQESAALAQSAAAEATDLRQKLTQQQTLLADKGAALTTQQQEARELAQENRALAEKARRAEEADRLQAENSRLTARVAELENLPKPAVDATLAPRLAQAQDTIGQLQQQLQVLQTDKAGLEKLSQTQEKNLRESAALAQTTGAETADLKQKFARAQQQLEVKDAALASAKATAEEIGKVRQELLALQAEKAGLDYLSRAQEKNLQESTALAQTTGAEAADLKQQLARLQKQFEDQGAALATQEQDARKFAQENRVLAEKARRAEEADRLQTENSRLTARVTELENQPKPVVDETLAPRLTLAQETLAQLQQQLQALQTEKDELSRTQEKNLRESAALAQSAAAESADLRQRLSQQQTLLADKGAALTLQQQEARELAQENRSLAEKARRAEEADRLQAENSRLAARVAELENLPKPAVDETLVPRLAQAQETVGQLQQQLQAVQTEKDELSRTQEKNLRESAALAQSAAAEAADLRQRLAGTQKQLADRESALAAGRSSAEEVGKARQQLQVLQVEKARLEKLAQEQGKSMQESAALAQSTGTEAADLRQKLTEVQSRLADKESALAAREQETGKLAQDNQALAEKARRAEEALAAQARVKTTPEDTGPLRQQLAELQDRSDQLTRENQALADKAEAVHGSFLRAQARVAALENDLRAAQKRPTGGGAGTDDLKRQLADTNQLLARSAAMVAELTASGQDGQQELARAKAQVTDLQQKLAAAAAAQDSVNLRAMREELEQLRREAAGLAALREEHRALTAEASTLRARNEQLTRDGDQLAGLMAGGRRDLDQAHDRMAELEKQLEAARTSRAREADDTKKLQEELAGLTAANARLKNDLAEAKQAGADMNALREEHRALAAKAAAEHDGYLQAQARVAALESDLQDAMNKSSGSLTGLEDLKKQLAEANRALERSGAGAAGLTAANARLENDLAAVKQAAAGAGALRDELARLRTEAESAGRLREENGRLRQAAEEASSLRARNEQLTRDSEQLAGFMTGNRRDLDAAQARVAGLEKQLEETRAIRTRGGDDTRKLQTELAEAGQNIEKLNATVAELTGANDRLEMDLDSARKSTAAALAAQSQAVNAAQPDAYKMEISTLQAHVKELEGQMEEERNNTAKEIATLASQLQRTRETSKSLTEANRALLSAKQSEQPTVDKNEFDQLQARVRDLAAAGEELRRQNQKFASDNQNLAGERASLQQQLEDARKVATVLPGLADEKAALQERLEAVGAQLMKTQQEVDSLQKDNASAVALAAASKQAADRAQADLAALQNRTSEAERASESHNLSVAELTQANTKLELEREDMRRLVESYRADINRLTQSVRSAEQQRVDAERGAQQNVDAVAAQLGQMRRDLEATRTAQARMAEAGAAQERERVAIITQLRTENSALAARLNQAQGTLDQIAAAARLGTPASTLASGGVVPARPVTTVAAPQPEVRYHTVTEGDSLSRISLRYYGTPNRWQEIFQANRDVLQGSSVLRVGMQLRIP